MTFSAKTVLFPYRIRQFVRAHHIYNCIQNEKMVLLYNWFIHLYGFPVMHARTDS